MTGKIPVDKRLGEIGAIDVVVILLADQDGEVIMTIYEGRLVEIQAVEEVRLTNQRGVC
jgi:hypothetical protein